MINQYVYSNLTVLIRSNREESINYLRINALIDDPSSVAFAAVDAFYCDVRGVASVPSLDERKAAGALWNENECEIIGLIHGHPTITTSGCDTVASLCNYLKFGISSDEAPRKTAVPAAPYGNDRSQAAVKVFAHRYGAEPEDTQQLISVFVGNDDSEPDYDTFLSVVAASHDTEAVIAAVKADYEASRGAGHWNEDGAFIVGAGEGSFRGAWNPDGLAVADLAAVCAGVLGGAK